MGVSVTVHSNGITYVRNSRGGTFTYILLPSGRVRALVDNTRFTKFYIYGEKTLFSLPLTSKQPGEPSLLSHP